jgi:hypothetical protein
MFWIFVRRKSDQIMLAHLANPNWPFAVLSVSGHDLAWPRDLRPRCSTPALTASPRLASPRLASPRLASATLGLLAGWSVCLA